jgi:hypothetical protein
LERERALTGAKKSSRMTTWTTMRAACGTICLAGSLFMGETAKATEFGLSEYILGLTLPMSGYTPPTGVYFLDTFVLYQAGGSLYPATGPRSNTRVTENFVADIAIVGWFPDFKAFRCRPGLRRNSSFLIEPGYSKFDGGRSHGPGPAG